jgi:hypothetical protein
LRDCVLSELGAEGCAASSGPAAGLACGAFVFFGGAPTSWAKVVVMDSSWPRVFSTSASGTTSPELLWGLGLPSPGCSAGLTRYLHASGPLPITRRGQGTLVHRLSEGIIEAKNLFHNHEEHYGEKGPTGLSSWCILPVPNDKKITTKDTKSTKEGKRDLPAFLRVSSCPSWFHAGSEISSRVCR